MSTEEQRAEWKRDAERYPSGRPCDGIHDATPDRRILVLLDALAAHEAREARVRALADLWNASDHRTWISNCGDWLLDALDGDA